MSTYTARVEWRLGTGENFLANKYSRAHSWSFDGGLTVPASSSPEVVPIPLSRAENVDPEEALIASASSCHMLWFLALAAKKKFSVSAYSDDAVGILAKDDRGKLAITRITLRPRIAFAPERTPSADELAALHHEAHELCFIANSLRTEIAVES